jgi:hypothetical protein
MRNEYESPTLNEVGTFNEVILGHITPGGDLDATLFIQPFEFESDGESDAWPLL